MKIDLREVDLCTDCFRKGMQPFQHEKTHGYRVRVTDKLQAPIYTGD
ncbi:unnamed protein product, partial [Laminaria digitata]